mgnify:CR=1 FL=1|jgi:prepilin peptidase CpaA
MLAAIILTLFPVLMFYSALSDVLTMTIANWVSITLVATFCVVAVLSSMSLSDFGWHVSCGVTVLLITFFFFARGWIGGGDAKLASATSLWMGWENVDEYSLLFALFGGVLTLVILVIRFGSLPAFVAERAWMRRLRDKSNGVPYGVALACAGMIVYPQTSVWLSAAAS